MTRYPHFRYELGPYNGVLDFIEVTSPFRGALINTFELGPTKEVPSFSGSPH